MRTNAPTLFKTLLVILVFAPADAGGVRGGEEDPRAPEAQRSL